MGSQEWMRKFDAARAEPSSEKPSVETKDGDRAFGGNPVANKATIEHPHNGHADHEDSRKDLLH